MLKRPSTRRKHLREEISLNLVPILDTMVTLIAFLLFTMSFLSIVTIESPFPVASAEQMEEIKERPLQLTVTLRENEAEIWSPFERIESRKLENHAPGQPDLAAIHSRLLEIKQQFPRETKVVFVPVAGISYDVLISVMDSMRTVEASDPPLFVRNEATGNDEPVKSLFPDVIFGNLLGDT